MSVSKKLKEWYISIESHQFEGIAEAIKVKKNVLHQDSKHRKVSSLLNNLFILFTQLTNLINLFLFCFKNIIFNFFLVFCDFSFEN